MDSQPGPSKTDFSKTARVSETVRYGDANFEEKVLGWFEECDSDASDIEKDVDEDFAYESEHDTASEISADSESDDDEDETSSQSYIGKNRFKWSANEVVPKRGRTLKHNIVVQLPGLKQKARALGTETNPSSVWNLLFSEYMIEQVVRWTNVKIGSYHEKYKRQNRSELSNTDSVEIRAFLGMLIYSAVFNSNHESIRTIFATDGTGRDIFRCVMSKDRFAVLLACLRFDNPQDRQDRRKNDSTAPISEIFDKFIVNCQEAYSIGQTACIDEMLVSFRGRCSFRMYMPNKPGKYGLKLMCLTDARNGYLYNSYIYSGKNSDGQGLTEEENKLPKPTQSVIRLSRPLFKTNRNITADNWFSSVELALLLKQNGLTYVGTMKKNKREIPPNFLPAKKREVGTALYGFTKDLTLLSYAGRKGKSTILISSMHHSKDHDPLTNKPAIISFYNLTKGGVDSLDEKCSKSTTRRRTQRWPMAIFFRIIDICCNNAYILHQSYRDNPQITEKSNFLKQLARELVEPHMRRREANPRVSREIKFYIRRVLGIEDEAVVYPVHGDVLEKRKICSICPSRMRRMTKYTCNVCHKPICLQCTKKVCATCMENL